MIKAISPDHSEHGIVERLRAIDAKQNAKNALLALGTLALGLLLFAPADHSEHGMREARCTIESSRVY